MPELLCICVKLVRFGFCNLVFLCQSPNGKLELGDNYHWLGWFKKSISKNYVVIPFFLFSLDIYEEFEFYAGSRLSHLEDGASAVVSDSASSGAAPDPDELTASVRRLTELIGQLQRLEETRSRLIGEVAQSDQADLTLASLKTIQSKKMSSLNRGIGGQGIFKIKGRSSKSGNVTSVPVNPEVSKIEEVS